MFNLILGKKKKKKKKSIFNNKLIILYKEIYLMLKSEKKIYIYY